MPMIVSQGSATVRALILGGTAEAGRLADAVADAGIAAIYSYGGRTLAPARQKLPTRSGGFGGPGGLAAYLREEGITHVVDATHPFAAQMSRHAAEACAATGTKLIALERAAWTKAPGDRWIEVAGLDAAVAALPERRARVFLAIGRQHVAAFAAKPHHDYLLRFVDPPGGTLPLPDAGVIVSRGPFGLADEVEMLRARAVEWIVARNAGGAGARAKVDAARMLGLPVVMIGRPPLPERPRTESIAEVLDWLGHRARLGA